MLPGLPRGASAQAFPSRSITMVVPVAAGGALDTNARLVAEGVETAEQLRILSSLDCHKAQGYLISHPVDTSSVPSTVAELQDSPRWRM